MKWNEVPVTLDKISILNGLDPILEDISIEFHPGKVCVLLGHSGCGKSTLLKTAAGLIPLSSGQIFYGDKSIYRLNQKDFAQLQQHTGFMFQDGALWANMSIKDNLSLPQIVADSKIDKQIVEERVMNSLKSFNLYKELNSRPSALSAGERKIISYLRAVIAEPEILFMDEPTSFIDRKSSLQLINELYKYKKAGKTIILITHDLSLANSIGDYFVFMHNRKIELYDTVQACMKSENINWINFIQDQNVKDSSDGDKIEVSIL